MKKSALLAVSALSLGVVGLATFTPVVNAVDPATSTATVTVSINGTLGVGGGEEGTPDWGENALDVTFSMKANDFQEKSSTVNVSNNTGTAARVTLQDADSDTNLGGSGEATGSNIPAVASPAKGTSGWGVKVGEGAYRAMPANGGTAIEVGSADGGVDSFTVTYGVGTSADQASGSYTDDVIYTVTQ